MSNTPEWKSGDIVIFSPCSVSGVALRFIVDGYPKFTVAYPDQPYHRLRVKQNLHVEFTAHAGRPSLFILERITDERYSIRSVQSTNKSGAACYLGVDSIGHIRVGPLSDDSLCTSFRVRIDTNEPSKTRPVLNRWMAERFMREGFIHIPQLVPHNLVFDCQHLLMHSLGIPGALTAGGAQRGLGKLGGSLSSAPEVRGLLTGDVLQLVEEIMGGPGTVGGLESITAQIALRFPEVRPKGLPGYSSVDWHTDGLRQGKTHGFSLLLGVCLSNVFEELHGNLMVWPATHCAIHKSTVGECGAIDVPKLKQLLGIESEEITCTSKPHHGICHCNDSIMDKQRHDNEPQDLPYLGEPLQIRALAGDIVLLHPDTAHTGGPNYSCNIRSMVYFRLKHRNIREHDASYSENMWEDLPGILNACR